MSARPVFHPALGRFFREWRSQHTKMTQKDAAEALATYGVDKSYGALQLLEAGKVKHPNHALIRALAQAYGAPPDLFAAKVVEAVYGKAGRPTVTVSVTGEGDTTAPLPGGDSDSSSPADARVRELAAQVETLEAALADVARHLDAALTSAYRAVRAGSTGVPAGSRTRSRRRRDKRA